MDSLWSRAQVFRQSRACRARDTLRGRCHAELTAIGSTILLLLSMFSSTLPFST